MLRCRSIHAPQTAALENMGGGMKKHEIAILSFKVLSIYAVIQSIYQVYNFLYFLAYQKHLDNADKYNLLIASVPSILMILCAIILWFGSPLLASKIFRDNDRGFEIKSTIKDIQRVAFSVVGLFLLSTSLPAVVGGLSQLAAKPRLSIMDYWRKNERRVNNQGG